MNELLDNYFENETKKQIKAAIPLMTHVEKSIAQFFINNETKGNFALKEVASLLYTSEATLSRFAKKCGYKGYRELIFSYERDLDQEKENGDQEKDVDLFTKVVRSSYQNLLNDSFSILDREKIRNFTAKLNCSMHVKVFGIGNSGFAAREFQLRFMRIGLDVEAVTDSQIMQMTAALANDALKSAKSRGVYTVLFTAERGIDFAAACDEVIYVASLENLDTGSKVSPQFPILVVFDVIYTYYFANDFYFKEQKLRATLSAISDERGKSGENISE